MCLLAAERNLRVGALVKVKEEACSSNGFCINGVNWEYLLHIFTRKYTV